LAGITHSKAIKQKKHGQHGKEFKRDLTGIWGKKMRPTVGNYFEVGVGYGIFFFK
jgi:hypothetical protein